MTKADYENLLKRIEKNLLKDSKPVDNRFELPPVDVMWEGQKTFLRNFTEYPNCLLYTSPSPRDGLLSRMPSSA